VLATMNPVERFGSFELPESQLDRFLISISLGYPDRRHELEIYEKDMEHVHAEQMRPACDPESIRMLREKVREVRVESSIMGYLLDVVRATRDNPLVRLGISSRGGLHLKRAMQANALTEGRDYVVPEDLRDVFLPVATHRILLAANTMNGDLRVRKQEILTHILQGVESPI
jgi:MoxR-like ATPase